MCALSNNKIKIQINSKVSDTAQKQKAENSNKQNKPQPEAYLNLMRLLLPSHLFSSHYQH